MCNENESERVGRPLAELLRELEVISAFLEAEVQFWRMLAGRMPRLQSDLAQAYLEIELPPQKTTPRD